MPFETACGSVIGTSHLRAGRNGQDGWAIERDGDRIVIVVTDGCGSARHSEVGAKLGARLVAREVLTRSSDRIDWVAATKCLLDRLAEFATNLDVNDYLLFTIVGALITPEETTIFHAGDGIFAINGAMQTIGPYPENAPPYLAYALSSPRLGGELLTIAYQGPTSAIQSILLATDGAEPLVARGDFPQFANVSRNPDAIRRRLFLLTRPASPLLDDDTTVALARRMV